MTRLLVLLEFDGTAYAGWQRQPGVPTVQGTLETALERLCNRPVPVVGAGRTDSGVHALRMPAHFDVKPEEIARIERGLNRMLPGDIASLSVNTVTDDFHARFSAVSRTYEYRIGAARHPLRSRYEFQPRRCVLDTELMQEAAKLSLGYHSWRGFAKEGSGNSSWNMKVFSASVAETASGWTFRINANRFLRGVVRIWSGTLFRIGMRSLPQEAVTVILNNAEKRFAGPSLPACGLVLTEVEYPYGVT